MGIKRISAENNSPLPYADIKSMGAADFYFSINATFRFILERFGKAELVAYWRDLGESYFAPVTARWKRDGLNGIAAYWRAFFAAEPGAEVGVDVEGNRVVVRVITCPAIKHLRSQDRDIVSCFCAHCYYVGDEMAKGAGYTVRVEGGAGSCRQVFCIRDAALPPQDMTHIKEIE